jgi:hypothetical protein
MAAPMTESPRVNHTNRVFKNTPNNGQGLSAQPAAVIVEEMAPGGVWAPRYRDIRRDLTNESPRVRRTSSSWRSREKGWEEESKTVGGSMDVRAAAQARAAAGWAAFGSPPPGESAPNLALVLRP